MRRSRLTRCCKLTEINMDLLVFTPGTFATLSEVYFIYISTVVQDNSLPRKHFFLETFFCSTFSHQHMSTEACQGASGTEREKDVPEGLFHLKTSTPMSFQCSYVVHEELSNPPPTFVRLGIVQTVLPDSSLHKCSLLPGAKAPVCLCGCLCLRRESGGESNTYKVWLFVAGGQSKRLQVRRSTSP